MAATVPEKCRQTGEVMGYSTHDEEDQTGDIAHLDSTCGLNGVSLGATVLEDRESESQALDCDPSENSLVPDADFNLTSFSQVETQDCIPIGQTADSSQPPSNDDQETQAPENKKRKRGRPRKRVGYIGKNSRKTSTFNADQKNEGKRKTPAQKRAKVASEIFRQTSLPHDSPADPEPNEMTPSGRPKRRAAKVALEYLHNISMDLNPEKPSAKRERERLDLLTSPTNKKNSGSGQEKVWKRKAPDYDCDQNDDSDFDPERHKELESEEEDDDDDDEDHCSKPFFQSNKTFSHKKLASNGLSTSTMQPVWTSFKFTKEFHEKNCSPWVFPQYIPSGIDWHLLSVSEAEKYLPQQEESVTFTLSREGIKEQSSLHKMKRFQSLSPHMERWDSLFFVGGPVWAMEWCPCPDGAADTQYVALYSNKGMDDRHKMNMLYSEPALLQLWDLGKLQMSRPSSSPHLAYALAVDSGCIWCLKWCPAGAWELPTTKRKVPHMPRLGLVAAAFSNGTVAVYSLPHPEALMAQHQTTGESRQAPLIYRVRCILTLKLGSSHAGHSDRSGQCFTLDWLPVKPHNIIAAGFYDGTVALWDLNTKSYLQRVKSPDESFCLYPYHCFLAHDNTIRSLSWCRASSKLMVTVGIDRMVKLWDLMMTCTPLKAIKRFLPTEVSWPIFWSGIYLSQEYCFSTLGQQGLHYLDSGYFGQKPFYVCSRKATVWSLSMSDWMNSCVIGDNGGDLVYSLLCEPDCNNSRRQRFPVYRTELVQFRPGLRPRNNEKEEEEEVKDATQQEPQSYREAAKKYYLHFQDMDLRSFTKYQEKPLVKQLHSSEIKGLVFVDHMPLNALYKVRFNPNIDAHGWVLSAGQSGLVRAHCVSGLDGQLMHKLVNESEAQFSAMFRSQEHNSATTAIHHFTADTVQIR